MRFCKLAKGMVLAGLIVAGLSSSALAVPTIVGTPNPPPFVMSTTLVPPQTAIADQMSVVPIGDVSGTLQALLTKQGYSPANNWNLVTNAVPLAANATFTIDTAAGKGYFLTLNPAGNAFGEEVDFTLNPNPAAPAAAAGTTVTEHWLQYVNTSAQVNTGNGPYGFTLPGQQGFYQLDNGAVNGGAAAGATLGTANAPYYDSNAGNPAFVPPSFHDFPKYYSGVVNYRHFF
jgi:hypothetical protein